LLLPSFESFFNLFIRMSGIEALEARFLLLEVQAKEEREARRRLEEKNVALEQQLKTQEAPTISLEQQLKKQAQDRD